jgi:hypothetical protein
MESLACPARAWNQIQKRWAYDKQSNKAKILHHEVLRLVELGVANAQDIIWVF